MSYQAATQSENAVALLRRLARPRKAEERCEFCSVSIGPIHRHLLEFAKRRIVCACDACALRFQDVVSGRFRLVPRDVRFFPEFHLTEALWDDLALPINLAFFFRDSAVGKVVALYPSPAGVTESLLPSRNWGQLERDNPALAAMQPDVEALLVNRIGNTRDYFITPIDLCYELVGLMRMHWRGLAGGETVWKEIGNFFETLRIKAGAPSGKVEEALRA